MTCRSLASRGANGAGRAHGFGVGARWTIVGWAPPTFPYCGFGGGPAIETRRGIILPPPGRGKESGATSEENERHTGFFPRVGTAHLPINSVGDAHPSVTR